MLLHEHVPLVHPSVKHVADEAQVVLHPPPGQLTRHVAPVPHSTVHRPDAQSTLHVELDSQRTAHAPVLQRTSHGDVLVPQTASQGRASPHSRMQLCVGGHAQVPWQRFGVRGSTSAPASASATTAASGRASAPPSTGISRGPTDQSYEHATPRTAVTLDPIRAPASRTTAESTRRRLRVGVPC